MALLLLWVRNCIKRRERACLVSLLEGWEVERGEGLKAWKAGADDACVELDYADILFCDQRGMYYGKAV
jgi:hypothetical protein